VQQLVADGGAAVAEWNADVAWQARARYRPLAWLGLLASVVAMVVLPAAVGFGYLAIPGFIYALRELYFGRPSAPGRSRMHRAMVSVDGNALRVVGPALTRRWPRHEVRSGWVDWWAWCRRARWWAPMACASSRAGASAS